MTSIMHPTTYADRLASSAKASLANASAVLRGRPDDFNKIGTPDFNRIGIPEHNGPDSPDNPWFIAPEDRIMSPAMEAAQHAIAAVKSLDSALGVAGDLSKDVTTALTRARDEAKAGVLTLSSPTTMPLDMPRVALQFDGAVLWIDLARNLMRLEQSNRVDVPVTIMPVTNPIDLPVPPVTIATR
jgi:hypothetical protein